jgi:O-antigen ligase
VPTIAGNNSNGVAAKLQQNRQSAAFAAIVVLSFLYFVRPEDFLKPLAHVPLAKITGLIAVIALIAGVKPSGAVKMPREAKLMIVLLLQLCLSVPTAAWKGGSFALITQVFAKDLILAILIVKIVDNLPALRRLLFIQAAAVLSICAAALLTHSTDHAGRLAIGNGEYGNANDLAILIAINLPLCFAFVLAAKSQFQKAFWTFGCMAMIYAIFATYSRSGFLAACIGMGVCLWDFGAKGRLTKVLVAAGLIGALLLFVVPNEYATRIGTIFTQEDDPTQLSGDSVVERRKLLTSSIDLALQNPIFGVGPGNFPMVGGGWAVAHNTYAELASETGFPGLIIFVLLLSSAYVSIRAARKLAWRNGDKELRLLSGALWAALAAYTVGAFFADTAYQLYVYFLLSYIPVVYRIAQQGYSVAPAPAASRAIFFGSGEQLHGTAQVGWMR